MITKKIYVLLLLLIGKALCYAQTPGTGTTSAPVFDLAPKSPQAAAISKYGSIPVNMTTGVPNISIPIYTIALKGLNVPIALSYNSSGIKVNEQATNVGLGWLLQTGGAVTSAIHGAPDFGQGGWLSSGQKTPQTGAYKSDWSMDGESINSPTFPTDSMYLLYTGAAAGKYDTQPDVFYASYLGKSAKFCYDQSGKVHLLPYRRIKIDTLGTPFQTGFRITDEDDNIYVFDVKEDAKTTTDQPAVYYDHGLVHVVDNITYYLSSVTTPAGDMVRFNYSLMQVDSFTNQTAETRVEIENDCAPQQPDDRSVHSHTFSQTPRISSIVSSKGDSVVFNYSATARLDMPGAQPLAGIVVYKQNNPAFSKSFSFKYSYFITTHSATAADNYRLRLDTVQQSGEAPYVFSYNTQQMPQRLSMAQDHWGYYNGQTNNNTLLPVDTLSNLLTGANRNPDPILCQAGMLTSIKYPTGGKTVFTYEPNTYYTGKVSYVQIPLQFGTTASTSVVTQASFTVPTGAKEFKVSYQTASPVLTGLENIHQFRTIQLKQGATLIRQFSGADLNLEDLQTLSAGTYTFRMPIDSNSIGVFINLYYRLAADADTTITYTNVQTGGLRIKATDDYAVDGTIAMNTSYDYSTSADSTRSSNVHASQPQYTYVDHTYQWLITSYKECDFNAQASSSVLQLNAEGGNNAYYTNVKVYKRNKAGSGYTSYSFLGGYDSGNLAWPYPPDIEYDWLNDQVLEQKDYKYNPATGTFNLLSKIENTYKDEFNESITGPHESYVRGIKAGALQPGILGDPSLVSYALFPIYTVAVYDLYTTWFHPIAKQVTLYNPLDTNRKVITTTNYYFDNPDHIEMTREEVSKSTGEHYNILMRYPLDYNPAYPYNSSPLVEKRVMINDGTTDRLTNAEITTYENQAGSFPLAYYSLKNTADIAPSTVPVYDGTTINSAYEKRMDYAYDSNDNMATITKDALIATGYHWGYNLQYPIAECKNAAANEFYFNGFEEDGTASAGGHTGHKYGTSSTVSWTPPNGRAYVIDYWYYDGAKWQYKEDSYTGSSYTLTGSTTGYDDIRIYPADAQITTYTYDPSVGVTSTVDTKGQTAYYEYDSLQRLMNIKDQYGNIVKHTDYHYQNQ